MRGRFAAGDAVQTPFGKGLVRDVRNHGRLLVEVQGRALVVDERSVSPLTRPQRKADAAPGTTAVPESRQRHAPSEVDLHGLPVEDALARIADALDAALLAGVAELRFIHGRSGGRIRGALHRQLRVITAVKAFRLDPRNPGVTIVTL